MLTAVQKITGQGAALLALSGQDLSLPQIEETLRRHIGETGISVIFTDLQAGSSTMAARKVLRDQPQIILVAGANLPMLLDFVLSTLPDAVESARHAAERGRSSIVVHGGPP
jgi:PTS system N-acetylgalactosamine-specific IIA component